MTLEEEIERYAETIDEIPGTDRYYRRLFREFFDPELWGDVEFMEWLRAEI